MKYIKKIKIDIDKKNFEVIPSVQYDSNTRYLHINLLNGSVPFDITGCSVKISGTKPDGTAIFNNCTVINAKEGFVEVELTEQMNAAPGTVKCELKLYDGSGVLTTKQFEIEVSASVTSKSITSSNEFKALTDTLKEVQRFENRFNALEEHCTGGNGMQEHSHVNKLTLDKITESENGKLMFNGKEIDIDIKDKSITTEKIKDKNITFDLLSDNIVRSMSKISFEDIEENEEFDVILENEYEFIVNEYTPLTLQYTTDDSIVVLITHVTNADFNISTTTITTSLTCNNESFINCDEVTMLNQSNIGNYYCGFKYLSIPKLYIKFESTLLSSNDIKGVREYLKNNPLIFNLLLTTGKRVYITGDCDVKYTGWSTNQNGVCCIELTFKSLGMPIGFYKSYDFNNQKTLIPNMYEVVNNSIIQFTLDVNLVGTTINSIKEYLNTNPIVLIGGAL